MIWDILKRDLKRKKTMNIIILLFVILATMFVASSVNNIVTVVTGLDYYFEKAGVGDYIILTMGENCRDKIAPLLDDIKEDNDKAVLSYKKENVIYVAQEKVFILDGDKERKIELSNASLIQSLEDTATNFFDENNNIVNKVEPGKVYLTSSAMEKNNLKVGDKLKLTQYDVEVTVEIAGRLKDAIFGSNMMGNTRFLLSKVDFERFDNDEQVRRYYGGEIYIINSDDLKALSEGLAIGENMSFNDTIDILKKCYMMDLLVAAILLVASICLILVAFVVLKFTITFTISEEFREIGVMKAIGIKNIKIRSIYLTKYLAIAMLGSVLGFIFSLPFSNAIMKSVTANMVLGNNFGIILFVISAIAMVLIIAGYAYYCTRKIKALTPLDAIRSGQTGERFKKKSKLRLGKSRLSSTGYMALNDVLSSPKRYMTVILAFIISSLLVFMLVNAAATLKSDVFIESFGKASHVYYTSGNLAMSSMTGEGDVEINKTLRSLEKKLKDNGLEADACIEVQYKYKVSYKGKEYIMSCQKGVNTRADDYAYYEGTAPTNKNEIAITKEVGDMLDCGIGDTIEIAFGQTTEKCLITGYFESMNLLGKIIRLHEDAPTNMSESSSAMSFQFDFRDNPSQKVIDERRDQIKEILDSDDVFNAAEYCVDCMGAADTIDLVKYLLLVITLIIIMLVTLLMERSFISDEKGEIAILKAIGFSDKTIIAWHTKRFVIVAVISIVVAIILSQPMTKLAFEPIFVSMGMHTVNFRFDLLQVIVIYPAIILATTIAVAALTSLYTRRINSRDMASIE